MEQKDIPMTPSSFSDSSVKTISILFSVAPIGSHILSSMAVSLTYERGRLVF
jgi:hypothetical protein